VNINGHLGELALRRRRAGETLDGGPAPGEVEAHLATCAACKARARALDDEQRRFEQEISFDRFAAGVERAARSTAPRRRGPARVWLYPTLAMAAAVALVVTFAPRHDGSGRSERGAANRIANRIKGGAGVTVRVAGATDSGRRASTRPSRWRPASGCASAISRVATAIFSPSLSTSVARSRRSTRSGVPASPSPTTGSAPRATCPTAWS